MKHVIRCIITVLMASLLAINPIIAPALADFEPDIKSKSAVLMDASTGTVIFEKNSHERLEPASITKVMTLLLVFEAIESGNAKTDDIIKISERAWKTGGSQVFLALGEEQTLETLIKCIIVASANDASVAVAEYIGGSYEGFVQRMNDKAKALGMSDTNFKNPHGLSESDHYSSALDIAIMSRELIGHKDFFKWSATWLDYLEHTDKKRDATMLANTNKLLGKYDGLDGIKTGFHSKAGHCFAGTAKRGDFRLISIVLNCENTEGRFNDTVKLLDYGFGAYDSVKVVKKDSIQKALPVEKGNLLNINAVAAEDVSILSRKGEEQQVRTKINIPEKLSAPVEKGQRIGTLVVEKGDVVMQTIDLIASDSIKKANILEMLKRIIGRWFHF